MSFLIKIAPLLLKVSESGLGRRQLSGVFSSRIASLSITFANFDSFFSVKPEVMEFCSVGYSCLNFILVEWEVYWFSSMKIWCFRCWVSCYVREVLLNRGMPIVCKLVDETIDMAMNPRSYSTLGGRWGMSLPRGPRMTLEYFLPLHIAVYAFLVAPRRIINCFDDFLFFPT